jgi:transcriptional regulator with XRE-family HTH domain
VPKTSERDTIVARLIDLLRSERLRQELSLNEVATRAGLSYTMVSRVEKRQRMSTIDTLLRISEALNVDLGILLQKRITSKEMLPEGGE